MTKVIHQFRTGACPGGAKGPEINKQKKGHQSKLSTISPIFC